MKYICNVKQTKSVSLNNKKAGDFKSHLLHISLANVVVSFLLCKFFCGKFKYKIENSMKVTKKDILSIKAGSSKVMQLNSYKDCVNARSYAYQLAFTDPREDVERYSTSIDKDKNQITIEAIKKWTVQMPEWLQKNCTSLFAMMWEKAVTEMATVETEEYLNAKQAAVFLGWKLQTLYNRIHDIPHTKNGKSLIFTKSALRKFMERK